MHGIERFDLLRDSFIPGGLHAIIQAVTGFAVVSFLVPVHFPECFEKLVLDLAVVVFNGQFCLSEAIFKFLDDQPRDIEMGSAHAAMYPHYATPAGPTTCF